MEFDALPREVRLHPLTQGARLSVRQHPGPPRIAPKRHVDELWVVEGNDITQEISANRYVYEATTGQFRGPRGPIVPLAHVTTVRFLTHPDLVPADAIALHSRGVRWKRAVGVWDNAVVSRLSTDTVGLSFVDEVWGSDVDPGLFRPVLQTTTIAK